MRVVVAEDPMLTREGIVRLLTEAGVEVVGQAADADALLHAVTRERPDVAVIDIRMPPTHTDEGLVAAEGIRDGIPTSASSCCPSTSSRATPSPARGAPGRVGYLLKERVWDAAVLVDALRRVAEGETWSTHDRRAALGAPPADDRSTAHDAGARRARADRRGPLTRPSPARCR